MIGGCIVSFSSANVSFKPCTVLIYAFVTLKVGKLFSSNYIQYIHAYQYINIHFDIHLTFS